jgi:hypothetical protein
MSRKVKPLHQSAVAQLKAAEEKLSKHQIGMFISRFVYQVETIMETINSTEVPKEFIKDLIAGLQTFYDDFEAKYPRQENGCGGKWERNKIEADFKSAIAGLEGRIAA